MNADPVLIDDDDVDMDPVVITDEEEDDKINCSKTSSQTVETIVLDDEPSETVVGTFNNNTANVSNKHESFNKSEQAFLNNLRNNRLMDKIVTTCDNMENSVGLPRVINKTLLPLYRDTSKIFKETIEFKKLLKNTLKLLIRDPDHKFLHIKTLCEALKSGRLRKNVPFVTLATNLKKNSMQREHTEIHSTSREITETQDETNNTRKETNYNRQEINVTSRKVYKNREICEVYKTRNNTRKNVKTSYKKKTKESETTVVENITKHTKKSTSTLKKTDVIDLDCSENESVDHTKNNNVQNDVIILNETETSNDNLNKVAPTESELEKIQEDANKENDELVINKNSTLSDVDNMDLDLLIPQNHVGVSIEPEVPHDTRSDLEKIAAIEKNIEIYKNIIANLEEKEVVNNSVFSPYIRCSLYKEKIVQCYKKICKINGNCEDIVKRREIRLNVANGHPPGPAKRLEQFLNSTIDSTGAVAFPDFSDVLKCVLESNMADSLGWSKQKMFQEATALFRQCGQALRKRRQTREYRDLLDLVRDKGLSDDPAENDPQLKAKLEQNKLIAQKKEEEILERYVNMENNKSRKKIQKSHRECNTVEFESDKNSSDSDSDSEQNTSLPNMNISTVNNQIETGESSKNKNTNINSDLLIPNNLILTPIGVINQCHLGESAKIINNNLGTGVTAIPSALNPILTSLLNTPFSLVPPNYVVSTVTNVNPSQMFYVIGDSPKSNVTICDNHTKAPPTNIINVTPDRISDDNQISKCLATEDDISDLELDSETNAAINEECKPCLQNSEVTGENEKSNLNDTQMDTSNTSDGVAQSSDPCMNTTDVKVEERIKSEPVDIQSKLDELGDSFVCTVFDVEDPFLVIEISSDGFSDDEL